VYLDIIEMADLMSCKGASESNLSRFRHVFSRRRSASNSAGDFLRVCSSCSKAGCITVDANLRPNVDFSGDFGGVLFSGFLEIVRIVDLSGWLSLRFCLGGD
jgi:hypothetical protein